MGIVRLSLLVGLVAVIVVGTAIYGALRADEPRLLAHRALHQVGAGALAVYLIAFRGRVDLVVFEVPFGLVSDPGVPGRVGTALLGIAVACYAVVVGHWLASLSLDGTSEG